MTQRHTVLLPDMQEILTTMGEQIKTARLRRQISVELVAERAFVSCSTVYRIEKGDASVSIGNYTKVLHALGYMDKDLLLIAKDEMLEKTFEKLQIKVPNIV